MMKIINKFSCKSNDAGFRDQDKAWHLGWRIFVVFAHLIVQWQWTFIVSAWSMSDINSMHYIFWNQDLPFKLQFCDQKEIADKE